MTKSTQTAARPRRRIAGEPAPGTPRTAPAAPPLAPKSPRERFTAPRATKPRKVATTPTAQRPSGSRWIRALIVLIAIAGLGLAAVVGWRWLSAPDLDTARDEATRAAISATETIFTFSSESLDEHSAASMAIMTEEFAEQFGEIAPALAGIAPDREFEVTSSVAQAAAIPCGSGCSADRVTVLVFFDQARLVAGLDDPAVLDNRAEVTLVKSDGSWLVDDIRAL